MPDKCYILPTVFACNADCIFCSTKSYDYTGKTQFMRMDEQFFDSLYKLKTGNVKKIEITGGGEPFLNRYLPEIIANLKQISSQVYIKMYTNGNILREIPVINEVNISCVHWDKEINQHFMRFKGEPPDFKTTIAFFRNSGIPKIRLAIPMIKGAIDNAKKLEKFVTITEHLVDEYVVRPLSPNTHVDDLSHYYQDFDYVHPKVHVDREFCCHNKVLIWATNNKFYNSWHLLKPASHIFDDVSSNGHKTQYMVNELVRL